jgi:hypothetical protein
MFVLSTTFYQFLLLFTNFSSFYGFVLALPTFTAMHFDFYCFAAVKAMQIFAFTAVIIGKSVKSCKMQVISKMTLFKMALIRTVQSVEINKT